MMILLRNVSFSIFQLFSFLFVVVFLLGALNLHFSDRKEYCVMTYMFEYPQFVRISVASNNLYPQYGLYSYSEGRLTEKARKMWFDGVPVLFLPGNSGSHMQVRSLASVALRKALSSRKFDFHFDYFSVSYNEDLSGLYGGILERETDFAAACIQEILNLYKNNKYTKTIPTSVILIGHSMGGIIAKRLLAYPSTLNVTSLAITLAAPLQAPVINFDLDMNKFYNAMNDEWEYLPDEIRRKKVLISFGNGPRDTLMPSGLTSSRHSDLSALTTAIPGVWVSPNHVSIVWCKQLVIAINKYLFSIVSKDTQQLAADKQLLIAKARRYFQAYTKLECLQGLCSIFQQTDASHARLILLANRSVYLNPNITRPTTSMTPDAFWYEDNRRVYQIHRPEIDVGTYLMIRLMDSHLHRFLAVEVVNVEDSDWLFGCNAMFTTDTHRYCKEGTSLTELSRWTGAAADYGKRKLGTIHLHDIKQKHPDWTHVIVRVASRKPVSLNVDINDLASRQITANVPFGLPFAKQTLIQQTQTDSFYYEILLPDLTDVYQAYLLYVEPTAGCQAKRYHVSAELHVPWAQNHDTFHYFTPLKRTPMKLRLFKSKPDYDSKESVKVTLILDLKCTYTVRIESSWYYSLAQLARNYTPALISYTAAIFLLATRINILNLNQGKDFVSVHSALISEGVKPYYALLFSRILMIAVTSIPFLHVALSNGSWSNVEMQRLNSSMLVLVLYMMALGMANIITAGVLIALISTSQLAHRALFRIMFRSSGGALADKMTWVLHRAPLACSALCCTAAHYACGAAALVGGAAFYGTILSKMYEEYFEDYVYKIMAKMAAKLFRSKESKNTTENEKKSEPNPQINEIPIAAASEIDKTLDTKDVPSNNDETTDRDIDVKSRSKDNDKISNDENNTIIGSNIITKSDDKSSDETKALTTLTAPSDDAKNCDENKKSNKGKSAEELEEELHNINFHMNMFILWLIVTAVNIPALLTWARNFKYSKALKPDTSFVPGLVLSLCSGCLWSINGPIANLPYTGALAGIIFSTVVVILFFGPQNLYVVNYGVTLVFLLITLQQVFDKEADSECITSKQSSQNMNQTENEEDVAKGEKLQLDSQETEDEESKTKDKGANYNEDNEGEHSPGQSTKSEHSPGQSTNSGAEDDNKCPDIDNLDPEASIYEVFKGLRERFSHNNDL